MSQESLNLNLKEEPGEKDIMADCDSGCCSPDKGIVYLRTNRFEVKLEGITFKARDFESVIGSKDFLFPEGKIWARPPIVGIDVMRHPRDPSIVLLILCFGVGCVILKFHSGDILPESISKFLMNERIQFVGFGIPEKKELFPFEELGLKKCKVDIGYLAAKILHDPKYKRCELAELARKVLRIKTMIGLTEASSFERHEQIKCAICQLFITWAISMVLLRTNNNYKKKSTENDSPRKTSFLKHLNSLPTLTEGWFKSDKFKNYDPMTNKKDDFDFWNNQKSNNNSPKKLSFLKNFNSRPILSDGWFKFDKFKKENGKNDDDDDPMAIKKSCTQDDVYIGNTNLVDYSGGGDNENLTKPNALKKGPTWSSFVQATIKAGDFLRDQVNLVANKEFTKGDFLKSKSGSERWNRSFNDHGISSRNPSNKDKPLKGILKCPTISTPQTPKHPNPPQEQNCAKPSFRRSVSFK